MMNDINHLMWLPPVYFCYPSVCSVCAYFFTGLFSYWRALRVLYVFLYQCISFQSVIKTTKHKLKCFKQIYYLSVLQVRSLKCLTVWLRWSCGSLQAWSACPLQLLEAARPPCLGGQLHPHSQLRPSHHPDPDPCPRSSVPVITPGSHRQPLLKVSWWATLIPSATWPPSALWRNIFTDLQDGDIGVFGRQLHVSHNVFFQSWLVVFFSNSLQRAQVTHFSEVQVLKFCSANPVVVCYLRNLCWAAPRLTFFYFFL